MSIRTTFFFILVIAAFFAPSKMLDAATLRIAPARKDLAVGEEIAVRVFVESSAQAMNAVSGTLVFPSTLSLVGVSTEGSIIDLWTKEPRLAGGRIEFEGIALNPGYQGGSGTVFTVVFKSRASGAAAVTLTNAAILANDGLGSNIITAVGSGSYTIGTGVFSGVPSVSIRNGPVALPVITDYSAAVGARDSAYVRGVGEPGAITKIVFKNVSFKSVGEQFIASLQARRKKLDAVLVKNDPSDGTFEFSTTSGLVAGAYNATPFLVDEETNAEKPGLGVQLLVTDSRLVRALVVLVNVLALLIPIVGLCVLIYFIPWYSLRRMRVIRKRLTLEEGKLSLSSRDLEREDKIKDRTTQVAIGDTPGAGA